MKKKLPYLLFVILLLYIPLRVQIRLFVSSIGTTEPPVSVIQNSELQQLIQSKTGVTVASVKISESDKLFGMMVGIPSRPQLILSRGLYETFTPDEMEYVVLHEVGHFALWHSLKELFAGLALLIVGCFILRHLKLFPHRIIMAIVLGIFFGILLVRIGRFHEYQADQYSLTRMSNPDGMISATEKFWNSPTRETRTKEKYTVFQELFIRGVPYEERIKSAKAEIEKRDAKN